jgi:hypothetical protein
VSHPVATPTDMDPIAGVSLEAYAWVSAGLVDHAYDPSVAPGLAAQRGISAESWDQAVEGWTRRIRSNPDLAREFNRLFEAARAS